MAFSGDGRWLWVSDWRDVRLFDVSGDSLRFVAREPLPFENVPLPVDDNLPNHSMGIAAAGDIALSSGWTEASSFQLVPGVAAPDLVASPQLLTMPRTGAGESRSASLRLGNDGLKPLRISGVSAEGQGFSFSDLSVPIELEPGDAEHLCSAALVPRLCGECLANDRFLAVFEGLLEALDRRWRSGWPGNDLSGGRREGIHWGRDTQAAKPFGQVFGGDVGTHADQHCAVHDVAQLADVPRPWVLEQNAEGRGENADDLSVVFAVGPVDELMGEGLNLSQPLAQRRDAQGHGVDAVEQIEPEVAARAHGL